MHLITPRKMRALAVLALGGVLALVGPAAGQTASDSTTQASGSGAGGGPFEGNRRLILAPTGSEGALGIDRNWNAVYSEAFDRRSMFVLTEVRESRWWIRTAELAPDGEPLCLQLGRKAVSATSCDATRRNQLFDFSAAGGTRAHPRYTIRSGARHLVQRPSGSFVGRRVHSDAATTYVLLDRGRADLPSLD